MSSAPYNSVQRSFSLHVVKNNKNQLQRGLPLIALLMFALGVFMPLWESRSFLLNLEHTYGLFRSYMVYVAPTLILVTWALVSKLRASYITNLTCLFVVANLLAVQHAALVTLSITLSPVSVIIVTAMAKLVILRTREIIVIYCFSLLAGFGIVELVHNQQIMSLHLYVTIAILLVWVLYLGSDHYKAHLRAFVHSKEQWRAQKQIRLQLMELEAQKKQLQQLLGKDALTGIFNRGYFDQHLRDEIKRTSRSSAPLGLLVVDIDHFKMVNDQLGHHTGDVYLTKVAKALEDIAKRPADVVARYGGEEFVLLLPDTDKKGLEILSQKILFSINELGIPHPIQSQLTVSIGGCEFDSHSMDKVSFFERADQALYRVKSNGRNNYFIAN
ncbi:GGDEF domain-containing protein [Vibrio superstes]|nr:GGDEF domain-containing protein [Vibrio superstes]